jgi:hypothetical protein
MCWAASAYYLSIASIQAFDGVDGAANELLPNHTDNQWPVSQSPTPKAANRLPTPSLSLAFGLLAQAGKCFPDDTIGAVTPPAAIRLEMPESEPALPQSSSRRAPALCK